MELAVPSFVFTPGRNFRERTASGRLTLGFERILRRSINTHRSQPYVDRRGKPFNSHTDSISSPSKPVGFGWSIHRGEKMKISAPSLATSTEIGTRLCEGMEIIGEVKFTDAMRVETKISGKVFSDSGILVVGEKGLVQATIEAGLVGIFGTVEGSITAKHKVTIHAGARVTGDIRAPELTVEHGAFFEGKCQVTA